MAAKLDVDAGVINAQTAASIKRRLAITSTACVVNTLASNVFTLTRDVIALASILNVGARLLSAPASTLITQELYRYAQG